MKTKQSIIALLFLSSTVGAVKLNQQHKLFNPDEMDVATDVEEAGATPKEVEETNPDKMAVSTDEMEEFSQKLHDKAGADSLFTESKPDAIKQAAPASIAQVQNTGPHALSDKNLFKPKENNKKDDVGSVVPQDSISVELNTQAWAKLPKDFSATQTGNRMRPKKVDIGNLNSDQYAQMFHEAAEQNSKEFDKPLDILVQENEDKKKRLAQGEDDEFNVPDSKDALSTFSLVQMKSNIKLQSRTGIRAKIHNYLGMRTVDDDDQDVLFVQDDDKKTEVKEQKQPEKKASDELSHVSGDDAQAYTSTMAKQSDESHKFSGEKEVDTSKLTELDKSNNSKDAMPPKGDVKQKALLVEDVPSDFSGKKGFYEQLYDKGQVMAKDQIKKQQAPIVNAETHVDKSSGKSTFEDIQNGNAPDLKVAQKPVSLAEEDESVCETCPSDANEAVASFNKQLLSMQPSAPPSSAGTSLLGDLISGSD